MSERREISHVTLGWMEVGVLTFWFDVAVDDTGVVEVGEAFEHLEAVDLDDGFVFDAAVFEETC